MVIDDFIIYYFITLFDFFSVVHENRNLEIFFFTELFRQGLEILLVRLARPENR